MTSDTLPDALPDALQPSDSLWSRWRTTPWRDVLRGRFTGSHDHRRVMAGADLPVPLLRTIDEVVRRTRLWPREKCDIAVELCAHFADGLQAGHSTEELQKTFGSVKESSRLIHRAKLRCRPWLWHVRRRGWQAMAVLALALTAIWSVLLIRFVTAKPTVTYDLVAEYDAESCAIPEDDRAWPFYRRGLVQIERADLSLFGDTPYGLPSVLTRGSQDPHWGEVREYLLSMQETVGLFVEGAQREQFGFINRDPANDAWRKWEGATGSWETYNEPGTPGFHILLAQTQDLRMILHFLQGAVHVAIQDGDGPRVTTLLSAMLNLPEHVHQGLDANITDLISFIYVHEIANLIASSIIEHPELFDDADLQLLSQRLHGVLGGSPFEMRSEGERRLVDDFVQRAFTDDGDGNGRFTAEGLGLLQQLITGQQAFPIVDAMPDLSDDGANEFQDEAWYHLLGSAVVTMVGDRREVHEKMIELNQLRHEAFSDPFTPFDESEFYTAVAQLLESPDRRRLLPIVVFYSSAMKGNLTVGLQLASAKLSRDAALVAIALEQYRRRTGEWPDDLVLLTPDLLAEVPRDLYATNETPLTYRVVDGRPLLYSVGPNRQDDGGAPSADGKPLWQTEDGDWILLPPQEPAP